MAAPMLWPMKTSRPSVGGSLPSAARTLSTASSGSVTGGVRWRLARPGGWTAQTSASGSAAAKGWQKVAEPPAGGQHTSRSRCSGVTAAD